MLQIEIPLRTFYKRCLFDYHIGDTSHYSTAINSKHKDCYNPHIATECDIQVKLGGIIDTYLISEHLPFSINAEMNVYAIQSQRADLSIHRIFSDTLYIDNASYKDNLECVIEAKYANAKCPTFDFDNQKINNDIVKLCSLGEKVEKVFAFIDEADNTPKDKLDWLLKECQAKKIRLFSNNKYLNYHLNFPYGFNQMFWLSRNKNLSEKDYIFGKTENFIQTVKDCFEDIIIDEETINIKLGDNKAIIYYASEFDKSKEELEGHILIETFGNRPLTISTINQLFEKLVRKNKSFLFAVTDKTETLMLE